MKNSKPSFEVVLCGNIETLVNEFQSHVIGLSNYKLVNLFLSIGQTINANSGTEQSLKSEKLGAQLSSSYGSFFNEHNVRLMGRIAKLCSTPETIRSVSEISWMQIQLLAHLKSEKEVMFYSRLAFEFDLSIPELQAAIDTNVYGKTEATVDMKAPRATRIKNGIIDTALKQQLHEIREIMNSATPPKLSDQNAFVNLVEEFKSSLNRRINAELNKLFWRVGTQINILPQKESIGNESLAFDVIAHQMNKTLSVFTKNMLVDMATYAGQITDIHLAIRLNKLLDWNRIRVLLPLQTIEEKYFYARLAATKGFSIPALKAEIELNHFHKAEGAAKIEQETISAIQNPIKRTIREEVHDGVCIGTEYGFSYGQDVKNSKAVSSVFNHSFFELLTT